MIKLDGKIYQIEKEKLEAYLNENASGQLDKWLPPKGDPMRLAAKGAIQVMLHKMGEKVPNGEDTIEFAGKFLIKQIIEGIEKIEKPLELKEFLREVVLDGENT